MTKQPLPVEPIPIPVAYRAFARPPIDPDAKTSTGTDPRVAVQWMLIFDTEPRIDHTQSLTFGSYRLAYRYGSKVTETVEEGIFYADDLPTTDPEGYQQLVNYVRRNRANVTDRRTIKAGDLTVPVRRNLNLASRHDWVEGVLWRAMQLGAVIVAFNAPFDLSRIAIGAGAGLGEHYGAFSLKIWDLEGYRPRIIIRHLDSKKSLISTGSMTNYPKGWRAAGFLDCRTLDFALTSESHKLEKACEVWGVEHPKSATDQHGVITAAYVEYNRRDVLATQELCTKLLDEFYSYGIPGLAPERALSSASLAKKTLAGLGVTGPLVRNPDFDSAMLGAAMESFYGGRSEVRTRRTHLPVEVHDFTSMYPTVNTLMNLWGLLTADRIEARDSTDDVRRLLDGITTEDCYDPTRWPGFVGIAQIIPDGVVLPVRGQYAPGENPVIGVNPLWSDRPTWFTIPDLIASKILTGQTPAIVKAIRFHPIGTAETLKASHLGQLEINPMTDDLFKKVIELRKTKGTDDRTQALLKVIANAGSYGIFSEFVIKKHSPDDTTTMSVNTGDDSFESTQADVEDPGAYCFPPVATCITGAARLMLALLEKAVTDLGGWWAFCDTDSMAIIASSEGEIIPCPGGQYLNDDGIECVRPLTPAQTATIRERFDTLLNPYDQDIIPNLLKREYAGTCYAVSAKRYAVYDIVEGRVVGHVEGSGRGRVGTEHGLGHLLNPKVDHNDPHTPHDATDHRAWTDDVWRSVVARDLGLDGPDAQIGWRDRAALGRLTVTSPYVWKRCEKYNAGKVWRDKVKPFNFLMMVSVKPGTHQRDFDTLISPYDSDTTQPDQRLWTDYKNLDEYAINYRDSETSHHLETVEVKNMADVIDRHDLKAESKYRAPDGTPCRPDTRGVLLRTPTKAAHLTFIGKEIKDMHDVDEPTGDPSKSVVYKGASEWDKARPLLINIGLRNIRSDLAMGDRMRARYREDHDNRVTDHQTKLDAARSEQTRNKYQQLITDESAQLEKNLARVKQPSIGDRQLRNLLNGGCTPHPAVRKYLIDLAGRYQRTGLHEVTTASESS